MTRPNDIIAHERLRESCIVSADCFRCHVGVSGGKVRQKLQSSDSREAMNWIFNGCEELDGDGGDNKLFQHLISVFVGYKVLHVFNVG